MPESLGAAADLSLLFLFVCPPVTSYSLRSVAINSVVADFAFVYCWSSIGPHVDHGHKETLTGLGARDTGSGSQRTAVIVQGGLPGCSMSNHCSLPKDHIPQKGDMIQRAPGCCRDFYGFHHITTGTCEAVQGRQSVWNIFMSSRTHFVVF